MAWFFTNDEIIDNKIHISGEDKNHIEKSLRMKIGEELTVCTSDNQKHLCKIESIDYDFVNLEVIESSICEQEPSIKINLFMSLLKSDKMDDIIQKSVELGVTEITPLLTARCISRPDTKAIKKKIERWQKIADNAARQSRRGIIPKVNDLADIKDFDNSTFDSSIVYFEDGGEKTKDLINSTDKNVAIIIGSEGGFEKDEIDALINKGVKVGTLGKRILRAQTAPLAAITILMYETNNME